MLPLRVVADLERAATALARLDGALLGSPLVPAWQFRATLAAATALAEADGLRPDSRRVAAMALGLRQEAPAPLLSFASGEAERDQGAAAHALRLFLLLRDSLALDETPAADMDADPLLHGVAAARAHLDRTHTDGPVLLAAGLGLRHWIETGGDRPSVWAALPGFLAGSGALRVPCPLVVGAGSLRTRADWSRPLPEWLRIFLHCVTREADQALTLLLDLERVWRQARRQAMAQSRSHSRLPQVVDLLALVPMVNPESLARFLSGGRDPRRGHRPADDDGPYCSPRGAAKILEKMEALGLVVELSGRGTHKVYSLPDLAPLRSQSQPAARRRATPATAAEPDRTSAPVPARLDAPPLDEAALDAATAELDAVLSRLEARLRGRSSDVG